METIYITDHGVLLKRRSNRIVLKKENKVIEEIPILDLKRILVFGNNQISTDLMRYLSTKGVDVSFLSLQGKLKFRLVSETSKNIYLRMAQHSFFHNRDFRAAWSRTIVGAKLKNQRSLLIRSMRNQPNVTVKDAVGKLAGCIDNLKEKTTIEEIMGVEGYGSKVYFSAFAKFLQNDFTFVKREYYPPPDPVNAMLSFGYMLLFNEINGILEAFGFDPFLGFLHSAAYGRSSLATDLIEELRSPVVDRLVIYLINLNVIKLSQFHKVEGKGIRMSDDAIKAYLGNYEKFMTTPFVEKSGEQNTYRSIIRDNALKVEKMLLNSTDYTPYILRS